MNNFAVTPLIGATGVLLELSSFPILFDTLLLAARLLYRRVPCLLLRQIRRALHQAVVLISPFSVAHYTLNVVKQVLILGDFVVVQSIRHVQVLHGFDMRVAQLAHDRVAFLYGPDH